MGRLREGPRQFSVSLSGFGLSLWWNDASLGRIVFGISAVLMVAMATYVWTVWWLGLPGWGKVAAPGIAALVGWLLF
jgi:hypothetical protein